QKAFTYTAQYDALIACYLSNERWPKNTVLPLKASIPLRYGENPHQAAWAYTVKLPQDSKNSLLSAQQHQGKPLSYNNLLDANAALSCIQNISEPACVIVKHTNPCGTAI